MHPFFKLIKEQSSNRKFKVFSILFLFAFVAAIIYSTFYFIIRYYSLGYLTILCACLFLSSYFLIVYGYPRISLLISSVSVVLFSFIGDFTFGWNYGSHFFLVCLTPLILASNDISRIEKLIRCSICITIYASMLQLVMNLGFHHGHDQVELVSNLLGDINLFVAFSILGFVMIHYSKAVKSNEKKLKELVNSDQLTGIPNRRCIYQIIDSQISNYNRCKEKFVVGLVDIDDFKKVNDTYGHLVGDKVLNGTVKCMQSQLRKNDFIGRWGGEEFLIILPQIDLQNSLPLFARVQKSFANNKLDCNEYKLPITITIGIAEYDQDQTTDELIRHADDFLYVGKQNGKNTIVSSNSGYAISHNS